MLRLLDQAQDAIRKALETKNSEIALSLLEQCQDSAIQIGGMIEEAFGEDFVTVGLLENYCEQIYQTYELIRQKQPVNVGKTYKNLRKELIRIENSVKNDIQVRTTAVFLPYKASMWDSLESVWKAADEDPNCDAYVVPIPYFDKNPDGSFREMHYEGSEYPKYVPITSWEEYDIAAEHPDMIFIHNPYDEFNHVTSVHPAYYSKELKNQTDLLVYIPYFILGEIDPDNKEAIENIEHFCTVPAVVYADKIIVQSKEWQKVYIDVMTKTMGNDTRKVWEEKIMGLGSPKMDKVHATGRDDLVIPKEWLKIIEKPDGSWKKIIFYNTSVSALLQYDEKMLEKMRYVFDTFKESKDEVALLWRPHPLIKATIESMRPQLWEEYEKLVRKYIEDGWGIYDDTADINRAIAVSDAYYGDPSSVVQMYEETGKPIMYQNVNVLSQKVHLNLGIETVKLLGKGKLHLQYRSGARVNNKLYFSELFFNALFELDLKNFSAKYVSSFSEEEKRRQLLHIQHAICYKDKIFFPAHCTMKVHYYDLVKGKSSCISIPAPDEEFVTECIVKKNNRVWLFSSSASIAAFVMDMDELSINNADALNEVIMQYKPIKGWFYIAERDRVYTYCTDKSTLLEVDLDGEHAKEYRLPIQNIKISHFTYHDGNIYFIDADLGDLYEWNGEKLQKFVAGSIETIRISGPLFLGCCFANGEIYMIPWRSKYVMKVKRDDNSMQRAFDYPEHFCYIDHCIGDYYLGMMSFCEVVDNKIWFHPCGGNQLLIYDTETGKTLVKKIQIDMDDLVPRIDIMRESELIPLDYFCWSKGQCKQSMMLGGDMYGKRIYLTVK